VSDSFMLSSTNSIVLARKRTEVEPMPANTTNTVQRFFELDPNETADIVAECEDQLRAKLLIEFPIFPFNDDYVKALSRVVNLKIESIRE
jgi:hypothetical protein